MAVDIDRQAKLAGQHHAFTRAVVKQNDRAVAAIVGFTALLLPAAIGALLLKGIFLQRVPVIG